ncbi:hypothetical protein Q766_09995 [Flavobacterium subsaxonicum WB 4.1-42 = DSM 21790]|uniref:Uncharacterized protein n=1 Tax=Flavobacterium subsaxonicum WB 4.1-42 = DSM 21790 TaxID=1121898 RepID=A0A0A2MMZ1_9FLAO|nr:hypothetical protein Q766_09995 [Flavobacterium subsaxonicum WB 4.1-42 = DSM 21790]
MNSDNQLLILVFVIFWATLFWLVSKSKNKKVVLFINGGANLVYTSYFVYGLIYQSDGGGSIMYWFYILLFNIVHWFILFAIASYLYIASSKNKNT